MNESDLKPLPSKSQDDFKFSRFGPIIQENGTEKVLPIKTYFTFSQKLVKEIKFVVSLPEHILHEQKYYWLSFIPIVDQKQRNDIKIMLEAHCLTPVMWLSNYEIEVNIDPACRIQKKRS